MSAAAASPEEVQLLREENAALRAQIAWLKQQLFGPGKSEKLDRAQLRFQLEELEQLAAKAERRVETITYERAKPVEPRKCDAIAQLFELGSSKEPEHATREMQCGVRNALGDDA